MSARGPSVEAALTAVAAAELPVAVAVEAAPAAWAATTAPTGRTPRLTPSAA